MGAQTDQLQDANLKREELRFTVGFGLINALLGSANIFKDYWPESDAFRLIVFVLMLMFLCIAYRMKLQSIERRGTSVILRPLGIAFSVMMIVFIIPVMLISFFLPFAFK